jgi:hypothetical protein
MLRYTLQWKEGDTFCSASLLLGESEEDQEGKSSTVSRASTIEVVLDFAEASKQPQSRPP